jgi:hypothetical protein
MWPEERRGQSKEPGAVREGLVRDAQSGSHRERGVELPGKHAVVGEDAEDMRTVRGQGGVREDDLVVAERAPTGPTARVPDLKYVA